MLSLILFISKASKFGLSCRNPAKNSVAVSARETRSTAPWTPPILIENYGMAGLPSSGVGTCALTASQVTTKSFQVSEYLLCPACEERLRLGGEDWVLANGCRGPKTFPLQSVLAGATPVANLTKAAMIGARTEPSQRLTFDSSLTLPSLSSGVPAHALGRLSVNACKSTLVRIRGSAIPGPGCPHGEYFS